MKSLIALAAVFAAITVSPTFTSAAGAAPMVSRTNTAPLSEREIRVFGEQIAREITAKDTAGFERALDVEAFLDRVLQGIAASDKTKNDFRAGFKSTFTKTLSRDFSTANRYSLLRVLQTNGQSSALFRMLTSEGALNYHEMMLRRDSQGAIRVVDIRIFMMGERLSVSLRRMALPVLASAERTMMERLVGTESDWVTHQKTLQRMAALTREKKYTDVLALYRKLPPTLQREKFLLVQRLSAAMRVDEKDYGDAIAVWEREYPRDPSLALVALDGLVLRKEYEQALKSIDVLDASVGGDPYLDVMRANQYRLLKNWTQTKVYARKALKVDSSFGGAYDALIAAALDQKDSGQTVRLLNEVEWAYKANLLPVIEQSEVYAEFRKSEDYAKWIKAKADRKAAE